MRSGKEVNSVLAWIVSRGPHHACPWPTSVRDARWLRADSLAALGFVGLWRRCPVKQDFRVVEAVNYCRVGGRV